jgi:murein L,D-transpeptidase YcbB/YkuD
MTRSYGIECDETSLRAKLRVESEDRRGAMGKLSEALGVTLLTCMLAASPAAALIPADSTIRSAEADNPGSSAKATALKVALDQITSEDVVEHAIIKGVRTFYEERSYEPLWLGGGGASPQAIALRQLMAAAAEYGLDPALYNTKVAPAERADAGLLAQAEIDFSRAVARFVTHMASGRFAPAEVSRLITLRPERPDIAEALDTLAKEANVRAALDRFEPGHPQYRALKAKLAELRASSDDQRIVIPEGPLLKPGAFDERVPLLRARLEVSLPEGHAPDRYNDLLVEAVQAFQRGNGLNADGILGPRTLLALNGSTREQDIATIIANLERWRWMPRDLGAFHVEVNVPEFMVRVIKDGAPVHETRIVVGTPRHPTPTFTHVIDHIVVNPYWNVPQSIIANEMMPDIRRNPYGFFRRGGYQVFARVRGRMRQINPYWVNWWAVSPRQIQIRQIPGDFNALGRIKFMFPNQHAVYLHDTPVKTLFRRDYRAFSHGCVRVENPLDFADAILPVAAPDWNSTQLQRLYGGKERSVSLASPIPIHLSYFTMAVDADGELRRFEDIYGYDGKIQALTGASVQG